MSSHNNQSLGHGTRAVVRISHFNCHQHPIPIIREVFYNLNMIGQILLHQVLTVGTKSACSGPCWTSNQQSSTTRRVVDPCEREREKERERERDTHLASRLRTSGATVLTTPTPHASMECTATTLHLCKRCYAFTVTIYSKTYLKRTPYVPKTWINGK
jgi:hypothetical protein